MRTLSSAMFLQFFTSTMVQQAQIEVALRLCDRNRALVITRMASMQSAAAAIQFLITPLWGRISDAYGRRPLLLGSNLIGALVRLSVVLCPS
eukprot:SAG31_NODE_20987_length_560_cov_1.047722_1_plen_91_part_10